MCLDNFIKLKKKTKIMDSIPEEGMVVYKVVNVDLPNRLYNPIYALGEYIEGIQEASISEMVSTHGVRYRSGFHFYRDKRDAQGLMKIIGGKVKIIECIVKKEWISQIGTEISFSSSFFWNLFHWNSIVIVANKAIFPKFEE